MNEFSSFSKTARFNDLSKSVGQCTLCPSLSEREHVLSKLNGDINSKVLMIAEAPGRLGADRTGIPMKGDRTGKNFEELIASIDWRRDELFITNAILCNPQADNGNNRTPSTKEIANCSAYLEMTIELVNPEVIVTLGAIALKALRNIWPHQYELKACVGKQLQWLGRIIVPLYHSGPRALIHRSMDKQKADYGKLASFVDPRNGILNPEDTLDYYNGRGESISNLQMLISAIVNNLGKMTYFKLTKLLYLADLLAINRLGRTLTGEIYLRQKEGPWPPEMFPSLEKIGSNEVITYFSRNSSHVMPGPSPQYRWRFNNDELQVIEEVLDRYGNLNNAGIKMAVYKTPPMRYIREQEKLGNDLLNTPVIYNDKIAVEIE